jgi:hypothetical protein
MSITNPQEAVMSKTVPAQHPAVVLRSHYRQLRSLLAVLVVAVVGLTATVVVMTVDENRTATTATSTHPATVQLADPFQGRTQPNVQAESASRSYPTLEDPFHSQVESSRPDSKPDESAVAAAISQQPQTAISAPDESKIASAIARHSETGPVARAHAYQQALRSMTPAQLEAAYGIGK